MAPVTTFTIPLAPGPIRHPALPQVTGFPRPRYKGHWAVGTRDLAASDRFYEALTGTQTICRPASFSTAISWDDEHHRFFIADLSAVTHDPSTGKPVTVHAATPQQRTGVGLASIRFGSIADLVAVYRKMATAGWTPERIVDRGAVLALVYSDPNGLLVEAFAASSTGAFVTEGELSPDTFLSRYA